MINKKIKIYVLSFLFLITPLVSSAQIPIGGVLLTSYECTCSGGWLMVVYDKFTHMTIPIVFQWGISRLNSGFNIFTPLTNVLGSYTPGGICLLVSFDCAGVPVIGTVSPYPMSGIGTSL